MSGTSQHITEPLNNARSDFFNFYSSNYFSPLTLPLPLPLPLPLLSMPLPPLITNSDTDNVVDSFISLAERPPPLAQLPRSLKIVSWNCCGLLTKSHQVSDLFEYSGADILILGETFRPPGAPWPSILPPLLAEATSSVESLTRQSAGVAILANPLALRNGGNIRSCEVITVDNVNGTKAVVKVNNLIIVAIYAPVSQGSDLLAEYLQEASTFSADGSPVVICGDFNAPHEYDGPNGSLRARNRILTSNLGTHFFRADTGPVPTRPANRSDSVAPEGNFLDHIYGANVNALESDCLSDFVHTSDHHPITSRVFPQSPAQDTSLRYWRLPTEKFSEDATRSQYRALVESALPALEAQVHELISSVSLETPPIESYRIVDRISHIVSAHILQEVCSVGSWKCPC